MCEKNAKSVESTLKSIQLESFVCSKGLEAQITIKLNLRRLLHKCSNSGRSSGGEESIHKRLCMTSDGNCTQKLASKIKFS